MRNIKVTAFACRRFVCAVLAITFVLALTACGGGNKEPLRAPEETSDATVSIETVYGTLDFPQELYAKLRHTEVTEGSIAVEIFYMLGAEGEKELYRIYYADPQVGTIAGYLKTDSGDISVSFSLCEYADETFADEEDRKLYYSMMDAFTVVMNSINADERFSENEHREPVGDRKVELRYWTVTLPENVQYTETEENGNYRVDFYGEVSGERIDLYMIGLGDLEGDTTLGMYTVDGVQKPVMVKTYNQEAYESWPQEERITIYQMMDTLNSIIQTVLSDENFA